MASADDEIEEILRDHVKKTFRNQNHQEEWRNLPELPSSAEIMPKEQDAEEEEEWDDYQQETVYDKNLPKNIVNGPWPSTEEYIEAHYKILREDAIAPLRRSVLEFSKNNSMEDNASTNVYTDVHIQGVKTTKIGLVFRVNFSYARFGKQIRWEHSKRLMGGTVVALTPHTDNFMSVCHIAVVADRPILGGLDQNPPTVDLFWADNNNFALDPITPYVMIEARAGYFEATRHVLMALQKLRTERFPLAEHIVSLDPDVKPPEYVEGFSHMDLSALGMDIPNANSKDMRSLHSVDVLQEFPRNLPTTMDYSQLRACEDLLTKKVAIVQGPPGTGKTFVSVKALNVMLDNLEPGDPPIIVSAQTNHALDQLLNHLIKLGFESSICRLGGRASPDEEIIQERTLFALRGSVDKKEFPGGSRDIGRSVKALERCYAEVMAALNYLLTDGILNSDDLRKLKIISKSQKESLSENGWVEGDAEDGINRWLSGQLMPIPKAPEVNAELLFEEVDPEEEERKREEMNNGDVDGFAARKNPTEQEKDLLNGEYLPFMRRFCGKHSTPIVEKSVRHMLKSKKNLYEIPEADRGVVYRYFELRVMKAMKTELQTALQNYQEAMEAFVIAKGKSNIKLFKHLNIKIIGCTTTGLSKYRGLISALKPRTLLIEEAAETLEGKILGGMVESLQQLILVGDHQQLQASCTIRALETEPYHMNVSMFERLIQNDMGFVMLNEQRRMVPEIRKLLCTEGNPFYHDLRDHEYVEDRVVNRPPVPGMGGKNVYFFTHNWPESRNADMSCYNLDEAEMIAGFFNYLVFNGVDQDQITVLTFYNGQRKLLVQTLKKNSPFQHIEKKFKVRTVDSYQGEENDIILVSLVRSNVSRMIGFLENKNRLVVALSRAKRGLYIFGNAVTLCHGESDEDFYGRKPLWEPLLSHMGGEGQFQLDGGLPIACVNHNTVVQKFEAADWTGTLNIDNVKYSRAGGCDAICGGHLKCGHDCKMLCHPFDHSRAICKEPCNRGLACGHGCAELCYQECSCMQCKVEAKTGILSVDDIAQQEGAASWDLQWSKPHKSSKKSTQPQDVRLEVGYNHADSFKASARPANRHSYSAPGSSNNRMASRDVYGAGRYSPEKHNTSNQNTFANRNRAPGSGIGNSKAWKGWDARKADEELAEKRRLDDESRPKVNPTTLVFQEIYRPINVENGRRMNAAPRDVQRRTVQRAGESGSSSEEPYPLQGPSIPLAGSGSSALHLIGFENAGGSQYPACENNGGRQSSEFANGFQQGSMVTNERALAAIPNGRQQGFDCEGSGRSHGGPTRGNSMRGGPGNRGSRSRGSGHGGSPRGGPIDGGSRAPNCSSARPTSHVGSQMPHNELHVPRAVPAPSPAFDEWGFPAAVGPADFREGMPQASIEAEDIVSRAQNMVLEDDSLINL